MAAEDHEIEVWGIDRKLKVVQIRTPFGEIDVRATTYRYPSAEYDGQSIRDGAVEVEEQIVIYVDTAAALSKIRVVDGRGLDHRVDTQLGKDDLVYLLQKLGYKVTLDPIGV